MDSHSDRGGRPGPFPIPASRIGTDLEQRDRTLDRMRATIRARHYSPRTEKAYVGWAARFLAFCEPRPAESLQTADVARFLTQLATAGRVSASTQNQAFSALLFLIQDALGRELGDVRGVVRAKRPVRVPLVLSRGEVASILGAMKGTPRLMAQLLYGAGLRLLECCRLRVKDVDFARLHLERVRRQHELDLAGGAGSVALPDALDSKYVNAAWEWGHDRRPRQRPREARDVPHAPTLLRHSPARGWLRHPDHPGAPRPP
jgi:integrase